MKRLFCFVMAALMLSMTFGVLAVEGALAKVDRSILSYTHTARVTGGEDASGYVSDGTELPGASKITWDAEEYYVMVGGVTYDYGELNLETAGSYKLTVYRVEDDEMEEEDTVVVLPEIDYGEGVEFYKGNVLLEYPTITCYNAPSAVLDKDTAFAMTDFSEGKQVTSLGKHKLEIDGFSPITFYIKTCTSEKIWHEASKKWALQVTVGEFEDMELSVTLDGTRVLETGANIVTAVGQHSVSAKNGENAVTSLNALPSSAELNLQVELDLPAEVEMKRAENGETLAVTDTPFWLYLSFWDATFYVDGEKVEEDYRVCENGQHRLTVCDAAGNEIENAFLLPGAGGTSGSTGVSVSAINLEFNNPNNIYAVIITLPALALLAAAVFFLVMRRRIV